MSSIDQFGLINALAQESPDAIPDYKALVCVFFNGGNDGNNMVIPYDPQIATEYPAYSAARSAAGLAIPQASLLQVTPANLGGRKFGLHPGMPELQTLFNQQQLAVVCNVGTLVQPLTKTIYQTNPAARPYQLFSHSDQVTQQQSSISNTASQTGWAGRTSDIMSVINGNAPLPMVISIAGTSIFATGNTTRPLAISDARTPLNQVLAINNYTFNAPVGSRSWAYDQIRALNDGRMVKASNDTTAQALLASAALSADQTPATTFPNTTLGNQLKQAAKVIRANYNQASLGLKRQIFFCSLGGFDHHSGQIAGQQNLLSQVSQAMKAFYDETVALGIADKVTTFTMADFGRTLQPAGSGATAVGSDHAWGNHHFVMGGAVQGGNFYGTYPTLALGGSDDTDSGANARGRWIPTTSIDQYAATLAAWYGLSASDIPTVFPFLGRFAASNLGFLL
ncbi:MAG: hypothetical protein QOF02_1091 [Blastocatellia bacterium]|jgi:uncharacterized protein (DUF1501 family)|nr:hypothetical protein [Blastocatellia bacterium]